MALQVIGSGFGRTGTRSMQDALELLGFGPCHHMEEVFRNPDQVRHWQAVQAGDPVDWNEVFAGYSSQVDWPGAYVWRELTDAFAGAKVVHTVRPDDSWWDSFSATIGKAMVINSTLELPPHVKAMVQVANDLVGRRTFAGRWTERDAAVAAYRRHTAEVRATLPADRLLVFDVSEGWEPLCEFLEVAVPDVPFPRRNTRPEFWAMLGGEPD